MHRLRPLISRPLSISISSWANHSFIGTRRPALQCGLTTTQKDKYATLKAEQEPPRSLEERKVLYPLPDLPDLPTRQPLRYVTQQELERYIVPLYSRRWYVRMSERNLRVKDGKLRRDRRMHPLLCRRYPFATLQEAGGFLGLLGDVAKAEDYEPMVIMRTGLQGKAKIYVKAGSDDVLGVPLTETADSRLPGAGLTLRDGRFANVLERAYAAVHGEPTTGYAPPGSPYTLQRLRYIHRITSQSLRTRVLRQPLDPELAGPAGGSAIPVRYDAPLPALPVIESGAEGEETFCSDEQMTDLLAPLYERGWRVTWNMKVAVDEDANVGAPLKEKVHLTKLPVLIAAYTFPTFQDNVGFAQELLKLIDDHSESTVHIWIDCLTVFVFFQSQRETPKIALRDVRLAMLTEQIFEKRNPGMQESALRLVFVRAEMPGTNAELGGSEQRKVGGYHFAKVARDRKDMPRHWF